MAAEELAQATRRWRWCGAAQQRLRHRLDAKKTCTDAQRLSSGLPTCHFGSSLRRPAKRRRDHT
eukprot:3342371-Prymnesium_polylepis.2